MYFSTTPNIIIIYLPINIHHNGNNFHVVLILSFLFRQIKHTTIIGTQNFNSAELVKLNASEIKFLQN
jgi:hypothetical protein